MKNKVFIVVIIILSLSVAVVAYAAEAPGQSDAPGIEKRQDAQRPPGKRGGKPPLMRILKGTFRAKLMLETPDGIKAVRLDRGKVVSVSETEIEIEESDGRVVTITFDEDTRFIGKKLDDISKGDIVQSIREKAEGESYRTKAVVTLTGPDSRRGPRRSENLNNPPPPLIEGELF